MTPRPVALRVITGQRQTEAQIAAHRALLADVLADAVEVHGNAEKPERLSYDEFDAAYPDPAFEPDRGYGAPIVVVMLGVLAAIAIAAGLSWAGLVKP